MEADEYSGKEKGRMSCQDYNPKHHIAIAAELLDALGDKSNILRRTSHASSDQVLALAAQAHIAMADFKVRSSKHNWRSDIESTGATAIAGASDR